MKYFQAKYLKAAGNKIDVKVSIRIVKGVKMIYIRDFEFSDFHSAVKYLQYIAENELANTKDLKIVE